MSSPANDIGISTKQYKEIWKDITVSEWLTLLSELRPDGEWKVKGGSIHGKCPYPNHTDSTPSFNLSPVKGVARCFGCGRGTTNPLQFWADVARISWSDALGDLKKRFGLRSISSKLANELQEKEKAQNAKTAISDALHKALYLSVEALLKDPDDLQFQWALPCINYLITRGVPANVELLRKLPLGVLPPLRVLNLLLGPDISLCMPTIEKYITAEYVGSLVFIYHTSPFNVGGIKLRADFLRKDSRRDILYVKNPDGEPHGLFGLGYYKAFMQGNNSTQDAIVVEGEFDALSNIVNQIKDDMAYDVVVATGGGAETRLDFLQDFGVSRALLVADAPEHGGTKLTQGWLSSNRMPMKVYSWPESVKAKDPDDAVKLYGWETWKKSLLDLDETSGERKNFLFPHIWAKGCLIEELAAVDPDDLRRIKEVCGDVGSCLKDSAEQRAFLDVATQATGLMPSDILSLIVGREDTEEGFIQRIIFALKQEYSFIGTEPAKTGGTRVQFWHKAKRHMKSCNVSKPSDMFSTFNVDLGNFVDWIRTSVGTPEWATHKRVGKFSVPMGIIDQEALLKRYVEFAVATLLRELPTLENLKELKAGSHYVDYKSSTGTEKRWVIVNGNDVFLGIPGDNNIDWRRLDGPKFGEYTLLLSRQKWSTEIRDTRDLLEGNTYNIQEAYEFLVSALDTGWKFRTQKEDVEYLAAAMMLNAVCSALPRQLYTMLNGTRGSGKSSFLALLTNSHPEMRLLEASFGMDSYTVAGFRKEMNNCSLGAVLDEFEDTGGDGHSRHVREILRDVRGLTSNPECRILRGNADNQESTAYYLRCQIWAAAIQYLRDEADVSRFVQVHTELVEGHPSPRISLGRKFSEEDFTKARRTVTMGLYRHVPALLAKIQELRQVYAAPGAMADLARMAHTEVPTRYLDGVIIPAALMALCGKNPISFIQRFVCAKAADLSRVVNMTHNQSLLDHLLSAQIEYKRPDSDVRFTTIRTLLSCPTDRVLLNNTDAGIHYIEFDSSKEGNHQRWLVVVWSDALQGVLRQVSAYRNETPFRLKQLAESDTGRTIKATRLNEVPSGMRKMVKFGITHNDFTIYNLTDTISHWDNPDRGV